jgi:hypothetical protein
MLATGSGHTESQLDGRCKQFFEVVQREPKSRRFSLGAAPEVPDLRHHPECLATFVVKA